MGNHLGESESEFDDWAFGPQTGGDRRMTRNEALQHVAEHLIGHLNGSTPEQVYPTDDSLSEEKIRRAMDEISGRLLRMGRPRSGGGA